MATYIKRGDEVSLTVEIRVDGNLPNISQIDRVEFQCGGVKKYYPNDVGYSSLYGVFIIPLTQQDTFSFKPKQMVKLDARVKFKDGVVKGAEKAINLCINDTTSQEVL